MSRIKAGPDRRTGGSGDERPAAENKGADAVIIDTIIAEIFCN